MIQNLFFVSGLFLVVAGEMAAPAFAMDGRLTVTVGYDDNLDERSADEVETAFLEGQGVLERPLFPEASGNLVLNGFGDARYEHRAEVSDMGEAGIGVSAAYPLSDGRWIPGLVLEGRFLQDDFLPEDDRNSLFLRFQIDFLATATTTVGLVQAVGWEDYREPVSAAAGGSNRPPFAGAGGRRTLGPLGAAENRWENGPVSRPAPGGTEGPGGVPDLYDRTDDLYTSRLWATVYPSPSLGLDGELRWTRVDSTIATESFDGIGGTAGLSWFSEPWEIRLAASGYRDTYDSARTGAGGGDSRTDTTWMLEAEIRRSLGPVEGVIGVRWTDLDSAAANESYRKTVTRCGLSWAF